MSDVTTRQHVISRDEIQAIADRIAARFNPHKIILFGSQARGDWHPHSDVDLLVIIDDNDQGADPAVEIALAIPHRFPIDILVRSPQKLTERLQMGDSFLRDIMDNGVILYERPGH